MTVDRIVHLIAGIMILVSIGLAQILHPYWIVVAAFVGLSLAQSGITEFCPLSSVLKKAGVKEGGCS